MPTPDTSIVIRTFNEERYLRTLLEGIHSQSYQDFEIVVVDSGSFDHTRDIAQPWCDKLLRISSQDFTFGYSLNVGIGASSGRFVVIVSAHTKPQDSSWLENLIAPLNDANTAAVYGGQLGGESSKIGEPLFLASDYLHPHKIKCPSVYVMVGDKDMIFPEAEARDLAQQMSQSGGVNDVYFKSWPGRPHNLMLGPTRLSVKQVADAIADWVLNGFKSSEGRVEPQKPEAGAA